MINEARKIECECRVIPERVPSAVRAAASEVDVELTPHGKLGRETNTKISKSTSKVDYDCEAKKSITFTSDFPRNMWAKLWRDAVVKRPEEA